MLARNQMIVGNYYYKRANFRAAESRFAELLQKYPETPVAPDALYRAGSLAREGRQALLGRAGLRRRQETFPEFQLRQKGAGRADQAPPTDRHRRRSAAAGARRDRLRRKSRRFERRQSSRAPALRHERHRGRVVSWRLGLRRRRIADSRRVDAAGAALKASSRDVPPVRMRPIRRSPIFPARKPADLT